MASYRSVGQTSGVMKKRKHFRVSDENPEWTNEEFARARPAREVLPELYGAKIIAAGMLKPRGEAPLSMPQVRRYPDGIGE
ncbi:MAG: hypothetical protein JWN85_4866 [Gammaproteobacteria bacterium]|nr:hypothetical protein [Gammaproteobacteria bacterium]